MCKKILTVFLIGLLLLSPVGPAWAGEERILVFIEAGNGFTVNNNGLRILPGEDAVFTVTMDRGVILAGTDYPGKAEITSRDREVTLTLYEVACPTRVRLTVSTKYCVVSYDANGGLPRSGTETVIEKRYSLTTHYRPNTETALFVRDGYTLLAWNTRSDGMGHRIGLGSRVSPENGQAKLYAQWLPWADVNDFDYIGEDEITITGYHGQADILVIPSRLEGKPVKTIAAGAFKNCRAGEIVLPETCAAVEEGAFEDCALTALTLFDSIESVSDSSFRNCDNLQTLYINAVEAPYGYIYRKESVYADKVELLIAAQGQQKLVFYGGCSVWYNLDAALADKLTGERYAIINMGLNGTVSSAVQWQIMAHFLQEGDILFHTPEVSSRLQLMLATDMGDNDNALWCGLENNYDLFSLVDLRTVGGVMDSLCHYLGLKDKRTDYQQFFSDDYRTPYMDRYGSVPFYRNGSDKNLSLTDKVALDPDRVKDLGTLIAYYNWLTGRGVTVVVSHACVNMDAVPSDQKDNVPLVDLLFRECVEEAEGVQVISRLEDYLYHDSDFYDTNYHLNSEPAKVNTAKWIEDLLCALNAQEVPVNEK